MSELDDPQMFPLLERACDGVADPSSSLAGWIAARPGDEQAQWNKLLAELQATREALSDVLVPANLETRLNGIAAAPLPWQWRDALNYRLRNWQIAACAAAIAMVVAYSVWPEEPYRPPLLGNSVVQQIAQFGVGHRSTKLQVASSDPAKVLALFKSQPLTFAAQLPNASPTLTLLGGAIARLGDSPAVMTRWHGSDTDFTVYQFDASALKLPAGFATVQQQLGAQHVMIWSGDGVSAWALISDGDTPFNPFCGSE